MKEILYIGIGGFFGSISRFLLSRYVTSFMPSFPLGTLFVNVTGSFILGFISYAVLYGKNINPDSRNMVTVGFIGAYTTMSTFAFESFKFAELSDYMNFGLNLVLNVFLCLLAIYLSKQLAIFIIK
jgi:CrcB protein